MSEQSDVIQVQGVNVKGFGTIPKLVMQDRRLTAQAKAIYAYFCSYAGAGKTAFPGTDRIIADLVMSRNAYYKHFNLLKEFGYIKVEQEKSKTGHFARNIYTIMEVIPCTKICDTEETHTQPCTNLRYTGKRDTVKRDTNINSLKNKQALKNNSVSENAPTQSIYGEFQQVRMTTAETDALIAAYGCDKTLDYINRLDRHIYRTGKSYQNHYKTIATWIAEDTAKADKPEPAEPKPSRFANFKQRDWDFDEIERVEREYLESSLKDNSGTRNTHKPEEVPA